MKLLVLALLFAAVTRIPAQEAAPRPGGPAESPKASAGQSIFEGTLKQYRSDGDVKKAADGYRMAIDADPHLIDARTKLADMDCRLELWDDAIEQLQSVITIGVDDQKKAKLNQRIRIIGIYKKFASPGALFAGVVSELPQAIHHVEPTYTKEARAARISGPADVWLEIDENGRPKNVQIVNGLGYGLDQAAVEAVSQWRFRPAIDGGKPVRCGAIVSVNFRLLP